MFNITKFESGTIFIQDNSAHASRIQVYEGELPAFIQKLSQYLPQEPQRTTNLNFWEAHQAMKRGEWVNFEGCNYAEHFKIDGLRFMFFIKEEKSYEDTEIDGGYLDTSNWYIVPKGPRYKVGDCFREGKSDSVEIIATATDLQGERIYGVAVKTLLGGVMRFDTATEQYIDSLERLPE